MADNNNDSIQWELYQKVCHKLKESKNLETLSAKFGGLKGDEERVKFVLDLDVIEKIVNIQPCFTPKSSIRSNDFRTEGNTLFKNKYFNESLNKYNQSILSSPQDDKTTTALAYANRSAVLFHLREYNLCLRDIQASLDSNYPEENCYKMFDRRGRCFKLLGRMTEAYSAFNEALKSVENSNLKEKDKISWKKDVEKKLKECSEDYTNVLPLKRLDVIRAGFPALPQLPSVNDEYIAASKAFDITISPSKGRYPVAAQDIDIGEMLVVEHPYASVLLQDCQTTHCHHCLQRTIAPIPCKQCSNVRYCSLECANKSWELYHLFECTHLDHIHSAGKYGHLALRTLLKAGLKHCKDIPCNINLDNNGNNNNLKTLGFNSDGVYDPSNYTTIFNLVGHTELRTVGDLFRRTVIAVYLLLCIQKTDFFLENDMQDVEASDDLVKAGGIILRHLQGFPCNAHEISELQLSLHSVETSVTMEIGAGIYATMSLFNHSCEPNVTRFFYGDTCVVRALTGITTGQEIADNYGVLSALTSRTERQKTLANQYYFNCSCEACAQDVPLFSEIAAITKPTLRCEYCKSALPESTSNKQHILCPTCNAEQDIGFKTKLLDKSEERLKQAIDKLFQGDVANSLPQIQSHLRILEKNVVPPWRGFNSCKELMKQCYNILANCHIVE